MAKRYDSRTTIFSPEGRLHQVSPCGVSARAVSRVMIHGGIVRLVPVGSVASSL